MIVQAVKWIGGIDGCLELIDQRKLPAELVKLKCGDTHQLFEAIITLAVRGAPAIGVAAAYGPVLALQKLEPADSLQQGLKAISKSCEYLKSSRPTAVNLSWAADRIQRSADKFAAAKPDATLQNLREAVLAEANDIYREDVDMCQRIGRNGEKFIKDGAGILTHCNAGALATAGQGTALSVIYEAKKKTKNFKVYVDETRPLLQGARLTAWELKQADIEAILICDNMAGWLMKQGKIDACLTGADRIAANGDTANKIGTYSLSVLAKEHNIPFYIAAPSSTFDLNIKSGAEIPIEQREAEEVTAFAETQTAPDEICVDNPAFDVTEAQDITAIITDKGVIKRPNTDRITRHLTRGARWYNKIVIVALIVLFGAVYLSTLLPGVSRGDSAEMQYASALLAVCHTPGYQIEVTFGKLFSLLSIGPSIAWRVNFMMAVFGTIGCLSLYGAVRRISGFTIPAIVAATTLGFSSIYWTHCLHAEVYVFYSSFLLLGVYTMVRFVQSRNQVIWLYLTVLFVGICVADRASELFVVPAFFLLWLFVRKNIRWGPNPRKKALIHFLLSLVVFILPFICTTILLLMRENTAHLHTRDNVLKHKVLSNNFDYRQPSFFKRIKPAMSRCLSLTYAKKAEFKPKRLKGDIDKYTWLLSGFGARGDRYPKKNWRENSEQGRGTSVGPLGLALAAAAIILQRKKYPWILFGTGLFLGNLAFFLWHSIWDNLTFTIPGQIGLCLLVGLGAAGWQKSKKPIRLTIFQMACLTAPAFLLITNYSLINMATPENTRQIEYFKKLSGALPEESVVIDSYWPAMALRYMIYVEAKRTDVYVFNVENRSPQKKRKLVDYFTKVGKPVFMKSMGIPTKKQQTLRRHTPAQVARLGLLLVNPEFWTVKQKQINQQP